jgi:phosphoserine phosphatase
MSNPAALPVSDHLPPYGTVVFDCDSTLCAIEGVDELARMLSQPGSDLPARVARATERAMGGEVPLEAVYAERLAWLRPDARAIEELGRRYLAALLPHARELVCALHELGKQVHLQSGGLLQALMPLAAQLAIAPRRVHAVELFLDRNGAYAGYDTDSPLTRSGGKLEVLRGLARQEHRGGLVLIGDGMSDLEAAPAARRFVAFGGVKRRVAVFERALVHCESRDLAALVELLLAPQECEQLALDGRHALLLAAARDGSRTGPGGPHP